MTSSDSLAIIVIVLGALSAIILFFFFILCCKFTAKLRKKQHRSAGLCHRTIIFEQQTTTSDDNNAELFSCCLDESTSMVHPERESDPISSSFTTGEINDEHAHHLKSLGTTVATVTGSTAGQLNHSNSIKHASSAAAVASASIATTHQPSPIKMPHAINVLYVEPSSTSSTTQGDPSRETSFTSSPLAVDTIDSGNLLRKMDQMNSAAVVVVAASQSSSSSRTCNLTMATVPSSTLAVSSTTKSNSTVTETATSTSTSTSTLPSKIESPGAPVAVTQAKIVTSNKSSDPYTSQVSNMSSSQSFPSTTVATSNSGGDGGSVNLVTECTPSPSIASLTCQSSPLPTQSSTATSTSRLFTKQDKGKRFTRSISSTSSTESDVKGNRRSATATASSSSSASATPVVVAAASLVASTTANASVSTKTSVKKKSPRVEGSVLTPGEIATPVSTLPPHPHPPGEVKIPVDFSPGPNVAAVNFNERGTERKVSTSSSKEEESSSSTLSIQRQESVDLSDDQVNRSLKPICVKDSSVDSSGSERSPETIRKQYKELWQLRAAFHAEELAKEREKAAAEAAALAAASNDQQSKSSPSSSSSAGSVVLSSSSSLDVRSSIEKLGDSGYKSTETRKDYSIDYKSESIYRQFTSAEGANVKVPSAHPSIEEEEEEEEEEEVIFV